MKRWITLVATALLLPGGTVAQTQGDVLDQFFRFVEVKNKAFEPHLPGETVDHFTGTLRIVQEDMSFPGKAGLGLRIIRTYSSKVWGRSDFPSVETFLADKEPTPVGFGWSMHMGRVRNPNATGQPVGAFGGGDYPVYEAPDGTARTFYKDANALQSAPFLSRDFWKFQKNCSTAAGPGVCITATSGLRLEFASSSQYFLGTSPGGMFQVWPLTAVVDVYGNSIVVTYQNGRLNQITDTYNRNIDFTYATCGARSCLQSITASGAGGSRQVTYSYTNYTPAQTGGVGRLALPSPGRYFLTGVQPGIGPGYTYGYGYAVPVTNNQYALTSITYPYGGTTAYGYETRAFFTGCDSVPMAVVTSRSTTGRSLTMASWTYDYSSPTNSDYQTTTVTRPDSKTDVYEFFGFRYAARMNNTGYVWKVGLQNSLNKGGGAEIETTEWDKGPIVAQANYGAPSYGGACPNWAWDTTVQSPIITKRVVARNGSRYEVDLPVLDHDQFGQALTVTETGEAQRMGSKPTRTTTYTYDYDTASNQIVGRIKNERVCSGTATTDCYVNARTFNAPHRGRDSETLKGVKSSFSYWLDGNLKTVTNALSGTMTLDGYDTGFGLATSIDFNGAFSIKRTAYWDGSLKSASNGRSDVTSYTYDAAGRIKAVSPPGNNDPSTYEYSPTGDFYSITRGIGPTLYKETNTLDGLGRVIATSNTLSEKQTWEYDEFGRLIFKSYPFVDSAPRREVGDKFQYDELDRPTVTSRRFVASGHYPLTGQCAELARCKVTVVYLGDHCKSATVERDAGDSVTTKTCFESFADVSVERLVTVTDARGKDWSYIYDIAGNLKTFTAPQVAGSRSFTFTPGTFFLETETSGPRGTTTIPMHNDLGQPLTQTDARNITTTFKYVAALSRLTLTQYGTGGPQDVSRTYDRDTLHTVSSDDGGKYTNTYDELSRITSQLWEYRGQAYTTGYHYDRTGCLDTLTYPTGTKLMMTCDVKGRTASVKRLTAANQETIADNVSYHPAGRLTSMKYGNGKTVTIDVEDGRVKSIVTPQVLNLTYTNDGASNVKGIIDAVAPINNVANVVYDELDRLLDVPTASGMISFRYDDLGNRKQIVVPGVGTTNYTYDPNTNRLAASSGPSVPPPLTLTWNAAERLETSSDGATYKYDGLGRRVAKRLLPSRPPTSSPFAKPQVFKGVEVIYHYDVNGHLLAETLPGGWKIREYYYVADLMVAVDGCISGFSTACGEREWYHTDVLGNVVARTESHGNLTARIAYQPWGEIPGISSGTQLFNSRTRDSGTGLYDFGSRMYSPVIARFISTDRAWTLRSDPQSANLFAFTLNNPYKYTDPNGAFALPVNWLGIVAGSLTTKLANLFFVQTGTLGQNTTGNANTVAPGNAGSDAGSRLDAGVSDAGIQVDAGVQDAGARLPWENMRDIARDAGFSVSHGYEPSGHNPGSRHYTGEAIDIGRPGGGYLPDGGVRLTNADLAIARAIFRDAGYGPPLDERFPPLGPDGGLTRVWQGPHLHISTDGH